MTEIRDLNEQRDCDITTDCDKDDACADCAPAQFDLSCGLRDHEDTMTAESKAQPGPRSRTGASLPPPTCTANCSIAFSPFKKKDPVNAEAGHRDDLDHNAQ